MEVIVPNPALPKKLGRARIHYDRAIKEDSLPSRVERDLHIPLRQGDQFDVIPGTEKFLFSTRVKVESRWDSHRDTEALFFGGMDEEPFLVRLDPKIKTEIKTISEIPQTLKPLATINLEKKLHVMAQRQGDIFAVPISLPLRAVQTLAALDGEDPMPKELRGSRIFGTRHTITGLAIRVHLPGMVSADLFEGVLQAPDHKELVLKGFHILEQNRFLFDPPRAD